MDADPTGNKASIATPLRYASVFLLGTFAGLALDRSPDASPLEPGTLGAQLEEPSNEPIVLATLDRPDEVGPPNSAEASSAFAVTPQPTSAPLDEDPDSHFQPGEPDDPFADLTRSERRIARQYASAYVDLARDSHSLFAETSERIFDREREHGRVTLEAFGPSLEHRPSEHLIWEDGTFERWVNVAGAARSLESIEIEDPRELELLLLLDRLRTMTPLEANHFEQGSETSANVTATAQSSAPQSPVGSAASLAFGKWPLPGMVVLEL